MSRHLIAINRVLTLLLTLSVMNVALPRVPVLAEEAQGTVTADLNKHHEPGELIVRFGSNVSDEQVRSFCADHDIAALNHLGNGVYHIGFSFSQNIESVIKDLDGAVEVSYVEPNYLLFADAIPNDPSFSELYGMNNTGQTGGTADADIDATEAWDVRTDASAIIVGVIDTGVDYNHPDLAANMWTNPGEIAGNGVDDDGNGYIDDIHGYDWVNNDGDPMDDHSHGTHCAGTIGAVGNNGVGVAGVSWKVQIMALKFLSASGSGSTSDAVLALQYANQMGAKITSNSWGGGGYSQAMKDVIDAGVAKGYLFVAAAGNSSSNNDSSPHYPSNYTSDNVISVAAVDHNDNRAGFSSYGATTVDLGAPGVSILSTTPGNSYAIFSGTSMATPHVSGAAALVWSAKPEQNYAQVRDKLYAGVDLVSSMNGITVTGGRLNVHKALAVGSETDPPSAVTDLAVDGTEVDAITLSWTATGDDGNSGTAKSFDIRYSTSPIDASNFANATVVSGEPDPLEAGNVQSTKVTGLTDNTTYYVAMKVIDDAANISDLSNVVSGTTVQAQVIYEENLESDTSGWTATGLWHLSQLRSSSATHAWYYGDEGTRTYNTGSANSGTLTSPAISLVDATTAILAFSGWREVESYNGTYDKTIVEISGDGGSTWSQIWYQDSKTVSNKIWETQSGISLANYLGKEVILRFTFNTQDSVGNNFEGWYVDDIKILGSAGSDTIPPTSPEGLAIADPGSGTVLDLSWTANAESDLAGYNVYRDGTKINSVLLTAITYQDTGLTQGTTYSYTLKAEDNDGNESTSSTAVKGVPGAPTTPTLNSVTGGSGTADLSWAANDEADLAGYNVYRNGAKINTSTVTGTSYSDSGLTNGTNYSYQITALDTSSNESAKSNALSTTPKDIVAPAAPTALSVSDPGNGTSLTLAWNANSEGDLAGYNVYRAGTKVNSTLVTTTSYTDSGLTKGNSYSYTIKAQDTSGNEGIASSSVSGIPGPPSTPSGFSASVGSKVVSLIWNANSEGDFAGYNVYRDGTKITSSLTTLTSYKDGGLTNNTTYAYKVSAVDSFGNESVQSAAVNATPQPGLPPTAPTGLSVTDPGDGSSLALSWSANVELDLGGYNVYRNGSKVNSAWITSPSYTDSGLTQGTLYTYTIKAVNTDDIEGNASSAATGVPGAPSAPSLSSVTGGDGAAALSWVANSEVDMAGYNVYRDGTKVNSSLVTGTSFAEGGLTNGTSYSYQISAIDTFNHEGSKSSAISVVPKDAVAPVAPTGLTMTDPGDGATLSLTWSVNTESDIKGYNIFRDGSKVGSLITGASFTDSGLTKGTSYSYTIKAQDTSDNESVASSSVTGIPGAPTTPTLNSVTGSDSAAALSWSASKEGDLAGYNIYRDGTKITSSAITGTTYSDTGLANGTEYGYEVTAIDTFGNESARSNAIKVTPKDTVAPATPAGVAVTDPGTGSTLQITWTANSETDIKGYNVYRDGTKVGSLITVTTNSFTDSGLTAGTSYGYTVSAQDTSDNESASSSSITGVPGAPATPTLNSATASDSVVALTWSTNSEGDLAGYNVYRDGAKINSSVLTSTSYSNTGLTNGTNYSYQVTAIDTSNNESIKSNAISVIPNDGVAPATPTGLQVADPGNGSVLNISWNANSETDIKGYDVYRGGVKVGTLITGTSFTDSGLTQGANYSYAIKAQDTSGLTSGLTNTVSSSPGAPLVPTFLSASAANGSAFLKWKANTEVDLKGYDVYRKDVTQGAGGNHRGGSQTIITYIKLNSVPVVGATYKVAGLTNGTPYTFAIAAVDISGNSSTRSNELSVIPDPIAVPPPSNLKVSDPGTGYRLDLTWESLATEDVAGYNIYRNKVAINTSLITQTNYQDSTVSQGQFYTYFVTAVSIDGAESDASGNASGVPGPPTAPFISSVTGSDKAAALVWKASSEADLAGYNVYRDGAKINNALITAINFADSGLTNGMIYSYQVTAVDTFGHESAKSGLLAATPKDGVAPAAPLGLAVTDPGTGNTLQLSWLANGESDFAGYNLYRNGSKIASLLSATSYTDSGLTQATAYAYNVRAQDTSGNESANSTSVVGVPGAPKAPVLNSGTASDKAAALNWQANTEKDLAGYNVYRDGAKINASLLTGTTFSDSGLTNGESYSYQISAVDSFGHESNKGNAIGVTPKDSEAPAAPAGLKLTDPGAGTILQMSWSANSENDIKGYNIYRDGSKISSLVSGTSFTDTGLTQGTQVGYTIKAQDTSDNESAASTSVTGVPGAPKTPSGLAGSAISKTASLKWSANTESDFAGYNLYRDGSKVNGALLTAIAYTDENLTNDTTYSYRVSAVDSFGNESAQSVAVTATPQPDPAPAAPAGLKLNDPGTGTTLELSWSANTEAYLAGYHVYRDGVRITSSVRTTTSYTDSGLTQGTSYGYTVKAINKDDVASKASSSVAGMPGAPAAPILSTVTGSDGAAALSWKVNAEVDLAGYHMYRDGKKVNATVVTSTSFNDSGLTNGTNYSYQISALDTFGNESAKSNAIAVVPKDVVVPAAPAGLKLTDPGTGNNLQLNWSANGESDIKGYNVYRGNTKVGSLVTFTSFTDSGLTKGIKVSYTIKAQDTSDNESIASASVSGVPGSPATPSLSSVAGSDSSAELAWTSNTEEDLAGYNVYRDGTKINTAMIAATSFTDSGLTNGTNYSYQVTASDTYGNESGKSNAISVVPKDAVAPAAPKGLKLIDPGSGATLQLNWSANGESDIKGYNVYRGDSKVGALVTGTSFTDSGLTKGISYSYTIKAQDTSDNEGAASSSVTGIPGAPKSPTLSSVTGSDQAATLSWQANEEADLGGYNVYRDGVKVNSATVTGTSFKDGALVNGASYVYQIAALDTFNNESSVSNTINVVPKDSTAPAAPAGIKLNDPGTGDTLQLNWTDGSESDIKGYNIYRDGSKISNLVSGTSFTDTGLTKGNNYSYTIKAHDTSDNESAASSSVTGVPGAPAVPTLSSVTGSDQAAALSWTPNIEADFLGYNVYRDGTKVNVAVLTQPSWDSTGLTNGTTYSYQVSAVDTFGNESTKGNAISVVPKDAVAPAAPAGLKLTDPGTGNILQLNWTANGESDIKGYDVYRGTTKIAPLVASTSFTDSGLTQGTSYGYTIKAQDTSGNESPASSGVTGVPGAPKTPSISNASGSDRAVSLNWTENNEADLAGYNIYRNGAKINTALISALSYADSGLVNGTTYTYQVSAFDTFGNESAKSGLISVVPRDTVGPSAPSGLTIADSGDGTTLQLAWSANAEGDIAGYHAYRNSVRMNVSLITATSFTDSGLVKGAGYSYVVKAQDTSENESEASVVAQAAPGSPGAPNALVALAGDTNAVLNWQKSPEIDIEGYDVYRKIITQGSGGGNHRGGTSTVISYNKVNANTVTGTQLTVSNLQNDTSHTFVVIAKDVFGNLSPYSNEVSVTPQPGSLASEALQEETKEDFSREEDQDKSNPRKSEPMIVTGDLNADGIPDILLEDTLLGGRLLLSQENGNYRDETQTRIGEEVGHITNALFIDMDRDGFLDLIVSRVDADKTNTTLVAFKNDQAGNLIHHQPFSPAVQNAMVLEACDVNQDAILDLVIGFEDRVEIWESNGQGYGLSATLVSALSGMGTPMAIRSLVFVDVDQDTRQDVIAGGNWTTVWLNNGFGEYEEDQSRMDNALVATKTLVGTDSDRGLVLDLFSLQDDGSVHHLSNDGKGFFVEGLEGTEIVSAADCMAIGDVDGDLDLDIVIGREGSLIVLQQTSNDLFEEGTQNILQGSQMQNLHSVLLRDLDADGDLDVILAGGDSSETSVYELLFNAGAGQFLPGGVLNPQTDDELPL